MKSIHVLYVVLIALLLISLTGVSSTIAAKPIPIPTYLFKTISGVVYTDVNGNGIQDAHDSGVAGITITLFKDYAKRPTYTTTTDKKGGYTFSNLPAGTYHVYITYPDGYTVTTASAAIFRIPTIGAHIADFGIARYAYITGYCYLDRNENKKRDLKERGIAGLFVDCKLNSASGAYVGTVVTPASGFFSFKVAPGTYYISCFDLAWEGTTAVDKSVTVRSGQTLDLTAKYNLFGRKAHIEM